MKSHLCTFFVGGLYIGIPVHKVQEVVRYQPMTEVPLAPAVIRGLLNLRGEILVAVDLSSRLGVTAEARDESEQTNVIVSTEAGPVSFLVDAISDVVTADSSQFEPTPATLSETLSRLILAVFKLSDRLLLVLDHERAAIVSESRDDESRKADGSPPNPGPRPRRAA